jgi:phage terminase large subunit-like protein
MRVNKKPANKDEIRLLAEKDLSTFVRLIAPHEMWGDIHFELFSWWTREDAKDNQLVLLPRDHKKSRAIAYRVAWWITCNPDTSILYVSATSDLAELQLRFIKDILTSEIYRFYWPEMVNQNENARERWTASEICVDHPKRKTEGVRDSTIKAAGLTSNLTGSHCNVAVLDDLVVPGNAYSETGRAQVKAMYSQLASIETTGAKEWVVGTRYHPADLYKDLMEMTELYYDETTDADVETPVYETFERVVETNGEFLWPKQRRPDGKTFGFDDRELARKKAKYLDVTQFYSQYYNNPNATETQQIDKSKFQYYNRENVTNISGVWYVGNNPLTIYASMDFAYSVTSASDYTVIMVVGVDDESNYYILDIERFKTNKISQMYTRAEATYRKWKFKKMRAEAVGAQRLIIQQFKDYMRSQQVIFTVDEYYPPATLRKAERIASVLEPRYNNNMIWHYKGGNCQILEEELLFTNSEHDDVKDALAAVIDIAKPAVSSRAWTRKKGNVMYHSKFGGVAFS